MMKSSEITKQAWESKGSTFYMGYQDNEELKELQRIELAARTCYKSEDKMTDESSINLFHSLVNKKHFAMLRFGERTVDIPENMYIALYIIANEINIGQYFRYFAKDKERFVNPHTARESYVTFTGNLNSWFLLYVYICNKYKEYKDTFYARCIIFIQSVFFDWPEMYKVLMNYFNEIDISKENYEFTYKEIAKEDIPINCRRHCFRVVTDRGITHEIVRHTTLSYAQESTRYVKYNGDNIDSMLFIPKYIMAHENSEDIIFLFKEHLKNSLITYNNLINSDNPCYLIQGEARNILPHCLKTEIVISGYIDNHEEPMFRQGFSHFVDMRDSSSAHRGIQPIAKVIKKTLGL